MVHITGQSEDGRTAVVCETKRSRGAVPKQNVCCDGLVSCDTVVDGDTPTTVELQNISTTGLITQGVGLVGAVEDNVTDVLSASGCSEINESLAIIRVSENRVVSCPRDRKNTIEPVFDGSPEIVGSRPVPGRIIRGCSAGKEKQKYCQNEFHWCSSQRMSHWSLRS